MFTGVNRAGQPSVDRATAQDSTSLSRAEVVTLSAEAKHEAAFAFRQRPDESVVGEHSDRLISSGITRAAGAIVEQKVETQVETALTRGKSGASLNQVEASARHELTSDLVANGVPQHRMGDVAWSVAAEVRNRVTSVAGKLDVNQSRKSGDELVASNEPVAVTAPEGPANETRADRDGSREKSRNGNLNPNLTANSAATGIVAGEKLTTGIENGVAAVNAPERGTLEDRRQRIHDIYENLLAGRQIG